MGKIIKQGNSLMVTLPSLIKAIGWKKGDMIELHIEDENHIRLENVTKTLGWLIEKV